MADEGLHAAEAGRMDRHPDALEKPFAVLAPARELQGEHAAGHPAAQDPARQLVLWMGRRGRGSAHPRRPAAPSSARATASAFDEWRSIRRASVFRPRSARNASHGEALPPALSITWRAASTRSAGPTTAPPMRSEWPPMYFVVECTTTSAPSASGLASAGDAKVLSTPTRTPLAWASSASAATSAIAVVGLLIVSSQSSFAPPSSAASTAA